MKRFVLWLALLIGIILSGCAAQVKTLSPPPYPPPVTPEATASVTGKIMLQGRMTGEGITVTVEGLPPVTTTSDGTYALIRSVPKGQHMIKAENPGYLSAEGYVTIVDETETKTLPIITLLAGDLNGDQSINLFDLVLMSTLFGGQSTERLGADLNGDGTVNLFDLVLVGSNLDKRGPIPFGSP